MPLGTNPAFLASAVRLPPAARRAAAALDDNSVQIPFNMQPQTQSNWCWAATSTSTSLYYLPTSGWTQCGVANAVLGLGGCCGNPVPDPCNVPSFLDRALSVTGNLVSVTGTVSPQQVAGELQAGRAVGARVGWSGGGGHFMVICGWATVPLLGDVFLIADPIYGNNVITVSAFLNGGYQGSGTWTTTYFTQAAPVVSKIRVPQISELRLRPVWEARPLLAALSGRPAAAAEDDSADVAFGLQHPIHVMGLRDLVSGGRIGDAPVAYRILESRGPAIRAFYDVSPSETAPELLQMAATDDDYGSRLERGIAAATRWAESRDGEADLRLLRIPALHTEALLVRTGPEEEETAIVIRTLQPELELLRPMPLSELVARLDGPARLLLDEDDDLKGS